MAGVTLFALSNPVAGTAPAAVETALLLAMPLAGERVAKKGVYLTA